MEDIQVESNNMPRGHLSIAASNFRGAISELPRLTALELYNVGFTDKLLVLMSADARPGALSNLRYSCLLKLYCSLRMDVMF